MMLQLILLCHLFLKVQNQGLNIVSPSSSIAGSIQTLILQLFEPNMSSLSSAQIQFSLTPPFSFADNDCQMASNEEGTQWTLIKCSLTNNQQLQVTSGLPSIMNYIPQFKVDVQMPYFETINNPNSQFYISMKLSAIANGASVVYAEQSLINVVASTTNECSLSIIGSTTILAQTQIQIIVKPPAGYNIYKNSQLIVSFQQNWPITRLSSEPTFSSTFSCSSDQASTKQLGCVKNSQSQYQIDISLSLSDQSSQPISVYFKNLVNPSQTLSQSPFTKIQILTTEEGNSFTSLRCTQMPSVQNLTPMSINSVIATMETQINAMGTLQLSVNINPQPSFLSTDSILIQLPIQINIGQLKQIIIQGLVITSFTPNYQANSIQFTPGKGLPSSVLSINLVNVKAPYSLQSGYSFSITISSSLSLIQQYQNSIAIQSLSPGTLNSVSLQINNLKISATTTYTFTFTLQNPIQSTGYFTIFMSVGFPQVFNPQCTLNFITTPQTCSSSPSGSGYLISTKSISGVSLLAGQVVIITLQNIINPGDTGFIGSIPINAYYSSSGDQTDTYTLQVGKGTSIVFQPGQLSQIQIIPFSASTVGQVNVPYTFQFANQFTLPETGYLIITYPNTIGFQGSASTCFSTFTGGSSICQVETLPSNQLKITKISQIVNGSNGNIPPSENIKIVIQSGFRNPLSSEQTNQFTLQTYTIQGNLIDQGLAEGIKITNIPMLQTTISPGSNQNSAITNYLFQIFCPIDIIESSYLFITFPPSIKLVSPISITSSSSVLSSPIVFIQNQQVIQIKLNCAVQQCSAGAIKSTTLQFNINNIQNYYSLAPSQQFKFLICQDQQELYIIAQQNEGGIITNKQLSSFSETSLKTSPIYHSENAAYTFSFVSNNYPEGTVVNILIPNQISIPSSIDCSKNYSGLSQPPNCQVNGKQIYFTLQKSVSQNTQITIQIQNLINPQSESKSDNIIIQTTQIENGLSYGIDTNSAPIFYENLCNLPCKDCLFSNINQTSSTCLSCYSSTSISQLNLYVSNTSSCVQVCPTGYTQSNQQCLGCLINCNSCVILNTKTQCTQCTNNTYLYQGNCIATCPQSTYIFNNDCVQCQNSCYTCTSLTSCTSCQAKYLLSNTCVISCPEGYYTFKSNCVACPAPCQNCSTNNVCTSCNPQSETPYLLGNTCLNNCPSGYYNSLVTGQCVKCALPCQTCTSSTQCSSCASAIENNGESTYLINKSCLTTCPIQYYGLNSVCELCNDKNCINCTQTTCNLCANQLLTYKGTCVLVCPTNYVPSSDKTACLYVDPNSLIKKEFPQMIPAPFSIIFVCFFVLVCVSKCYKHDTFLPGAMIGMFGLFETGSWAVLFLLSYFYNNQTNNQFLEWVLIAGVLAFNVLLNIVNFIYYWKIMYGDPEFQTWKMEKSTHKAASVIFHVLGLLFSFKISRIIYSGLFGFDFLKAKVEFVHKLTPLNAINGISIVILSCLAIFDASFIAYFDTDKQQLFISACDCIFVTLVMIVFTVWETQKHPDFFVDHECFYRTNKVADNSQIYIAHPNKKDFSFEQKQDRDNFVQNKKQFMKSVKSSNPADSPVKMQSKIDIQTHDLDEGKHDHVDHPGTFPIQNDQKASKIVSGNISPYKSILSARKESLNYQKVHVLNQQESDIEPNQPFSHQNTGQIDGQSRRQSVVHFENTIQSQQMSKIEKKLDFQLSNIKNKNSQIQQNRQIDEKYKDINNQILRIETTSIIGQNGEKSTMYKTEKQPYNFQFPEDKLFEIQNNFANDSNQNIKPQQQQQQQNIQNIQRETSIDINNKHEINTKINNYTQEASLSSDLEDNGDNHKAPDFEIDKYYDQQQQQEFVNMKTTLDFNRPNNSIMINRQNKPQNNKQSDQEQ